MIFFFFFFPTKLELSQIFIGGGERKKICEGFLALRGKKLVACDLLCLWTSQKPDFFFLKELIELKAICQSRLSEI